MGSVRTKWIKSAHKSKAGTNTPVQRSLFDCKVTVIGKFKRIQIEVCHLKMRIGQQQEPSTTSRGHAVIVAHLRCLHRHCRHHPHRHHLPVSSSMTRRTFSLKVGRGHDSLFYFHSLFDRQILKRNFTSDRITLNNLLW